MEHQESGKESLGASSEPTRTTPEPPGQAGPAQTERWAGPLLLFDGVCNLCNSAVRWLLARDKKKALRFASLQSSLATRELNDRVLDPQTLPDSMVLIDERGVSVRSRAAIGAGRHLGGVWSLAAHFAGAVPELLRDPVYDWIARNRYRWFGKSDLCRVPTAEERSVFLDADESSAADAQPSSASPAIQTTVHEEVAADTEEVSTFLLLRLTDRFVLVYFFVYMLPFPLTLLGYLFRVPGFSDLPVLPNLIGFLAGFHSAITQPLALALGRGLFGVEAEVRMTGSGDMTFNYLDGLLDLVLAVLITVAWAALRRGREISPRVRDAWTVLARYYLATTLLSYGFAKALPLQFPAPGADRLMQPYGDSSPMGLLWTFMGASPGYQIFGGLMELLGGYLLFFRRTALLGALVSAGVMANVVALNIFYDVPVKLYSSHLLLLAIAIALPAVPRLAGLLVLNLPIEPQDLRAKWPGKWPGRRTLVGLKIAVLLFATLTNLTGSITRARSPGGYLAEKSSLAGIYSVELFEVESRGEDEEDSSGAGAETGTAETRSDSATSSTALQPISETDPPEASGSRSSQPLPESERWVRVGLNPPFVGTVQYADGRAVRMRLQLDEEAQTIALFDRGSSEPPEGAMSYSPSEDGGLLVEGSFEGRKLRVRLQPTQGDALLTSRGFRWINEYPFNR